MIDNNKLSSAGAPLPQLRASANQWLSGYLAAINTASRQSGFDFPRWEDASRVEANAEVPPHPLAIAISEYHLSVSALFAGKKY
jgi:hypothetical protein